MLTYLCVYACVRMFVCMHACGCICSAFVYINNVIFLLLCVSNYVCMARIYECV